MLTAVIREQECIGCSKCIDACPVDAIIGARKKLHTVLTADCIGCKLCVMPCPVDCIEMATRAIAVDKKHMALRAKEQYQNKQLRKAAKQLPRLPYYNSEYEKKRSIKNEIKDILQRKLIDCGSQNLHQNI